MKRIANILMYIASIPMILAILLVLIVLDFFERMAYDNRD